MSVLAPAAHRIELEAIGTRWTITASRPIDPPTRARIDDVIARYDATWSRFRADSAVARLASTGGPVELGPEAVQLLPLLERLRELTGGAMDPFVGAALEHLGYGARGDLIARPGHLPAPAARIALDGSRATVDPPALLDVGSAGKGQLVDLVAAQLAGCGDVVVDAGGDIRVAGAPVQVALEHPFDPTAAIGVVTVADGAIAGSATNRRDWSSGGRLLHHVLDARTGRPVETVAATWALADSAMLADALSTALFLVPPEVLMPCFDFEWVRMRTDGVATWSAGLPGEVFR